MSHLYGAVALGEGVQAFAEPQHREQVGAGFGERTRQLGSASLARAIETSVAIGLAA